MLRIRSSTDEIREPLCHGFLFYLLCITYSKLVVSELKDMEAQTYMQQTYAQQTGVAVLDTGIYPHRDFGQRIIAFRDFVHNKYKMYDDNSHGTHVAGIIAGDGSASKGRYRGLAPESNLIVVKVLDEQGEGNSECVMDGMQWVIAHRQQYNIRVLNLSFGSMERTRMNEDSELVKRTEEVWDSGIVVVGAAGNNGPRQRSVTVPGISRKIITVGAYDDQEYRDEYGILRYHYSGRGPTEACIVKPEIVTAGSDIISCTNRKDRYASKSGTSMAVPIVAGAVALLLTKYPQMTPVEVKMRLHDRAEKIKLDKSQAGWGKLDLQRLLE